MKEFEQRSTKEDEEKKTRWIARIFKKHVKSQ
jgi:hypothetical protein